MTLDAAVESGGGEFVVEDVTSGVLPGSTVTSGFGRLGDGRTFSFHLRRGTLTVEVYRPRLAGPVPMPEEVVASGSRHLADLDVDDERSLAAAVRDAIGDALRARVPAR